MQEQINELKLKVDELERKVERGVSSQHQVEKEMIELKADLKSLANGLDRIDKNIGWLVKIVIGGFLTALMAFILKGGLIIG